jgi:hypothetical protein
LDAMASRSNHAPDGVTRNDHQGWRPRPASLPESPRCLLPSGDRLAPGGVRVLPVFRNHRGGTFGLAIDSRRVAFASCQSSGTTEVEPSVRQLARAGWRSLAVGRPGPPRRSEPVRPMRRFTAPVARRGPKTRQDGRSGSGFPRTHAASCELDPDAETSVRPIEIPVRASPVRAPTRSEDLADPLESTTLQGVPPSHHRPHRAG